MAGKKPFFLTGGNAKILLNNKTVAYATNVSFKVSVKHASPRVLGRFEVETIQPLSYEVMGSLTIIRYSRGISKYLGEGSPNGSDNAGSGIGSYKTGSFAGAVGRALGLPSSDGLFDGGADEAFNPARLFQSKMFNIEIRQMLPNKDAGYGGADFLKNIANNSMPKTAAKVFGSAVDLAGNPDDKLIRDKTNASSNEATIILLRDCRFEDMTFDVSKKGVATMNLTFKARYMDDDTSIARKSGVGQEFS